MNNYKPKYYNYNRMTKYSAGVYKLPEHSNKPFSDSLTALVNASGITDKELCRAMRVSPTTIGNYRKGARNHPKKEFMIRLADFFDIKPSYFWEYRKLLLEDSLKLNPEMLDVHLDISTAPQRVLQEYRRAKELSYQD
jgi:transcriptional regulator with XRE-family HTH domain